MNRPRGRSLCTRAGNHFKENLLGVLRTLRNNTGQYLKNAFSANLVLFVDSNYKIQIKHPMGIIFKSVLSDWRIARNFEICSYKTVQILIAL